MSSGASPAAVDIGAARAMFQSLNQIHLVAILPDGPTIGRDFGRDVAGALAWARQENESGRNIYFSVNEVLSGCHKKPTKLQILAARFCHVDIDPPNDGAPWNKNLMLAKLAEISCAPSFVVDSGNGLQAFWRLTEPIEDWQQVETLNAEIARQLGGDSCHNIDRLMRVPGFTNFPGASKRKLGRLPVPAVWGQADMGASYSLGELGVAFGPTDADTGRALDEWRRQNERISDQELIERCQRNENWHNSMITLTARFVKRGLSDADILALAARIALSDFTEAETRAEMVVAIRGAREKWSVQSVDPKIAATPFTAPDPFDVPYRDWVFGRWVLRGTVTAVIAPGGSGKSALMVAAALSLATGQGFLGKTVWAGPKRVWLCNLEDDRDELTRQIVACCLHHGISIRDCAGHLFVDDASTALCIATKEREGLTINLPLVDALIAEIRAKGIDVLIVDPFVSSHRAEENDNGQIDTIVKLWATIARETRCSIILVHHSRKLGGQQVDAESARGERTR